MGYCDLEIDERSCHGNCFSNIPDLNGEKQIVCSHFHEGKKDEYVKIVIIKDLKSNEHIIRSRTDFPEAFDFMRFITDGMVKFRHELIEG